MKSHMSINTSGHSNATDDQAAALRLFSYLQLSVLILRSMLASLAAYGQPLHFANDVIVHLLTALLPKLQLSHFQHLFENYLTTTNL